MKIIRLEFDYLIGPIIKDVYEIRNNKLITGVDVIDNDEELEKLNEAASDIYSSFYEFDNDNLCVFNYSTAKEHAEELSKLLDAIKNRINILSDGSFEINDLASIQILNIKKHI